jgi:hypothetical protein
MMMMLLVGNKRAAVWMSPAASSYNWRVDMGSIRKPRNESNKATLSRIEKEMAQPRIAKSARKGA